MYQHFPALVSQEAAFEQKPSPCVPIGSYRFVLTRDLRVGLPERMNALRRVRHGNPVSDLRR